jgi:hypothetical protein
MVFPWKDDSDDISKLSRSVNELRRNQADMEEDILRIPTEHACHQAHRIESVVASLEASSQTISEASTRLAVVDARLTGLEKSRDRVGAMSLTVALFLAGLTATAVAAFFALSSDVRVLSSEVEALSDGCDRIKAVTAENVARAVMSQMDSRYNGGEGQIRIGPDLVRDVCARATPMEKRMVLDALGQDVEGCEP